MRTLNANLSESAVRSLARRQGLRLTKSRRRKEFGGYGLIDPAMNALVLGDTETGHGMDLAEIERHLITLSR